MLRRLIVVLVTLLCVAGAALPGGAAQPHRWVMLSDVHFDPFAEPKLVNRLAAAPPERWRDILSQNDAAVFPNYGSDTNFRLLEATLEGIKNDVESPDAVIIAGDFLAHDFRAKFNKTAARHDDQSFDAFVDKTIRFLADEFHAAFARAPIYPVVGNNDGYCGDYQSTPGSPFLSSMAQAWAPALQLDSTARAAFVSQFSKGGYYTIDTVIPHVRIIALNDVFMSAKYANACGDRKADPAGEEMTWLNAQVKALPADRHAWVLTHEPPGIDVYSSLHSNAVVTFLSDRYNDPLLGLLQDPASRVTRVWAGHTHMNQFQLLGGALTTYSVPLQIIPAMSPIFSNNPSFVVGEFDTSSGDMIGEQTYVLDDLAALARDGRHMPHWRREFDFAQAFGVGAPDAQGYRRLHDAMLYSSVQRRRYSSYFDGGSGRAPIPEGEWHAYWCGQVALSAPSYRACAMPQIQASLPPQPTPPAHAPDVRTNAPTARPSP